MKFIGLTALCAAISMTGFFFIGADRKKICVIRKLSDFFGELAVFSMLSFADAVETIEKIGKMKRFSALSFPEYISSSFSEGDNLRSIWIDAVNKSRDLMCLDSDDKSLLIAFSDFFGKYSSADFSDRCREYQEIFNGKYYEEKKRSEKSRSVLVLTGILTATAVFIILM